MLANRESGAQGIGLRVIVALAVLTAVEYAIAIGLDSIQLVLTLLVLIALAKTWLIVSYFMHASRLWKGEEDHS